MSINDLCPDWLKNITSIWMQEKHRFISAVVITILWVAADVASIYYISSLINEIRKSSYDATSIPMKSTEIITSVTILSSIVTISAVAKFVSNHLIYEMQTANISRVMVGGLRWALAKPVTWHQNTSAASTTKRIKQVTDEGYNPLNDLIIISCGPTLLNVFLCLAVIGLISPAATMIATILILLTLWLSFSATQGDAGKLHKAMHGEDRAVYAEIHEIIQSHKEVMASFRETREIGRIKNMLRRSHGRRLDREMAVAVQEMKLSSVYAVVLGVLAAGVLLPLQQDRSSALTGFGISAAIIIVLQLRNMFGWMQRIVASAAAISGEPSLMPFISNAPASADGADGAEGERGRGLAPGDLVFEGVRFCYEDGRIGVDGFDATVARGSNVSIVGRTGSGKSTVSKLLLRFHEVDEGRILIGDVDIRSVPTRWLREHVYVVPQKPDLFTRTIWENIAYGSEGVGNDQICLAATAVQADAFIRQLPQGYDTVLAEGGGDLSGGERQRIAIARALLRRPSVLVLDEATSALDNATEQVVLSELRKWLPSTTIITIAHRLTAVTNSDKILVMSNGRVVEAGPPAALSAQDGFYSQLLKSYDNAAL